MSISILLADDHHIVRKGLRALLEVEPDFEVVGEASTGLEALDLAAQTQADILVLDLMMPGMNGLEVTRQVRQRMDKPQIIILSMHANEAYVLEALRKGASGYVLKDSSTEELVHSIRRVASGKRYLSAPISEHAIDAYMQKAQGASLDPYDTLTDRERQVLQLVAEGFGNQEIATRLSISTRTAETHRANLMRKLDLHSHTDLIRYALRKGIIE